MWDYKTTVTHDDYLERYLILIEIDGKASGSYITDILFEDMSRLDLISMLVNRGIQTAEELHAVSI